MKCHIKLVYYIDSQEILHSIFHPSCEIQCIQWNIISNNTQHCPFLLIITFGLSETVMEVGYKGNSTSPFYICPRYIMSGPGVYGEGTCFCPRASPHATCFPEGYAFAPSAMRLPSGKRIALTANA